MRLNTILPQYRDRIQLLHMAYPIELMDGEPPPRDILEQEWWLAALQEPRASFRPFTGGRFPTSTLPAFDAVKAAEAQGEEAGQAYDLRVRQAFFRDSADIGNTRVLHDLASEVGLDRIRFERDLSAGELRQQVLEEQRRGREEFGVRGTPTLILPGKSRARLPIGFPRMRDRRIVGVTPLPCSGDGCLDKMREILARASGTSVVNSEPGNAKRAAD